ncbi:hypothetical protein ACIBG0_32425 [Nocardia sp. NPDC050630]|uniref:hypothetical protein n=1 Tax=Nocardia sp. NPDC050630 TaxID=3364321 RepID=UPI0037B31EE0
MNDDRPIVSITDGERPADAESVSEKAGFDLGCGHVPLLLGQPISPVLQDNPGLTIRTS